MQKNNFTIPKKLLVGGKMLRFAKCLLCVLALSLLATACSTQNPADVGPSNSDETPPLCLMPMYFDSEEQLLSTISQVKSEKSKTDATADVVIVESDKASEQRYSAKLDALELAQISEFYKPVNILDGMSFEEISVNNEYISYSYVNEDQISSASFTWFRDMSPDVAMNGLYGRGAISEREIEHDGVKYVFLEWADPETCKSAGYSVHWVDTGKAYQAFVPAGYADDEILEFCQFDTVSVK